MLRMFWIGMIFVIYNAIYFKKFAHRPRIYSQNAKVTQIYSKVVYPLYFLPSGLLHSIYQIYRKISVVKESTRRSVVLGMPDNASLLLDIFEPLPISKKAKKAHAMLAFRRLHLAIVLAAASTSRVVGLRMLKVLKLIVRICEMKTRKAVLATFPKDRPRAKSLFSSEETNSSTEGAPETVAEPVPTLGSDLPCPSAPIKSNVLLVHGLNGSSNSTYIKGMTNVFLKKNCRVFCFNARGSRLPPKTNKFSHIGLTSDIQNVVEYILSNYSGDLTLVGFSMGANWVAKFLGECENKDRIKMGVGVCCPFDFFKLKSHFKGSLFGLALNYGLTNNYKRYIKRSVIDPIDLSGCRYLEDVDNFLLKSVFGSETLDEFYQKSSCAGVLDSIGRPFLFLSSSDDPLIPVSVVPVDVCKRNSNISLIILKGGHLGFFTNGKETMAETIVGKYYSIISQMEST